MSIKTDLILLASGGVGTSLAEFFLNYNLVDLVKDLILKGFRFITGKGKAVEGAIAKKL